VASVGRAPQVAITDVLGRFTEQNSRNCRRRRPRAADEKGTQHVAAPSVHGLFTGLATFQVTASRVSGLRDVPHTRAKQPVCSLPVQVVVEDFSEDGAVGTAKRIVVLKTRRLSAISGPGCVPRQLLTEMGRGLFFRNSGREFSFHAAASVRGDEGRMSISGRRVLSAGGLYSLVVDMSTSPCSRGTHGSGRRRFIVNAGIEGSAHSADGEWRHYREGWADALGPVNAPPFGRALAPLRGRFERHGTFLEDAPPPCGGKYLLVAVERKGFVDFAAVELGTWGAARTRGPSRS